MVFFVEKTMKQHAIYRTAEGEQQIQAFYAKLLADWPRPNRHHLISSRFGETFIVESGQLGKPALVFLHGSSSNSAMWIAEAHQLSTDYHIYAIDIIGECGKSAPNRPEFKNGNYTAWLKELLDALHLDTIALVGCSIGGWIALDFAIQNPHRVASIILVATAGITNIKTSVVFKLILTSLLGKWGFSLMNRMVYRNLELDETSKAFAELIKKYYRPRTDVLPLFSDDQLKTIESPVLFIGGDKDCFYPTEKTALRFNNKLKFAECKVLKDTGHVVLNQSKVMRNFLKNDKGSI